MYKSLGTVSIALTWVCILALITRFKEGVDHSISRHAIANKKTYVAMALFQSVMLPFFALFVAKWFSPTLHLGVVFTPLILASCLGLFVAAWIPDTEGIQHKIHEFCAYGAFLLFIPATALIINSAYVPLVARIIAVPVLACMISITLLFSLSEKVKRYHLYFQIIYLASIHLVILTAIYAKL